MKRLGLSLIALLLTTLVGCNTMHGIGQDISDTGENIKKMSEAAAENE